MAKRFMCNACNKSSASDANHRCEQTCSDCIASPPCVPQLSEYLVQSVIDISRAKHVSWTTNRGNRTRNLFASAIDVAVPVECYWVLWIATVAWCTVIRVNKTEVQATSASWVRWRTFCRLTRTMCSIYFMILRPHRTRRIPTLQKSMYLTSSACNCSIDCDRCGRRRPSFWNAPVGDLLTYLCEPRSWASKIVAISHNAKTFDLVFLF